MTAVAPASTATGLARRLRSVLRPDQVRDEPSEVNLYRRDASNLSGDASVVCFAESTDDVRRIVEVANMCSVPFVARGSGTGLAGGAVPPSGAIVISTAKMNRILSVDPVNRLAWVEPGVLNLDLSKQVAHLGVHFAPDPSSQQTCSIGGNVANNSGGPHCLADGVTSAHVHAIEVVLPDGSVAVLGGEDPEPDGYDLRGAFVGSEGMFGVATKVCVKLTQNPPEVATMLLDFADVAEGAQLVSDIIADGIVPAAVEMMDQLCLRAVEEFIHAGLPVDQAAALLIEVVGLPAEVAAHVERIRTLAGHRSVGTIRVAADDTERALLWKGRKSAFGAIARIKPNYYLHDTVVPRHKLPEVLAQVYEIAARHELLVLNVFHAGDGNLHPLLVYDAREPGATDRVHAAGDEIVRVSVAAGGVLSGEHGIGLEKRDLMGLMFSEVDLAAQAALRRAFDPQLLSNPDKVLPRPAGCGDLHSVAAAVDGAWV
ncbi:MAG TPA: FAD-linked oxidase C-terminal domain-containing protein [Ilumatobacteraceae bacterium]|nr:FAD-linked oxidase C-terminal domain-containing protein [Ilumatobacteraceae bacterium]